MWLFITIDRGEPIPNIQYTWEEIEVWGEVLDKLRALYPTNACNKFLDAFPLFNFRSDRIPQLQELSEVSDDHVHASI